MRDQVRSLHRARVIINIINTIITIIINLISIIITIIHLGRRGGGDEAQREHHLHDHVTSFSSPPTTAPSPALASAGRIHATNPLSPADTPHPPRRTPNPVSGTALGHLLRGFLII